MTPNPASQPSFSEHRSPARVGVARWKSGAAPAVLPLPAASSTPKVWLKDISLTYRGNNGSRLLALDSINLQVKAGEFLCIVGPSGCGKSTLLHLIAGLHQPSQGHVLVDDKLVDAPGTDRILIFQELGLFPWLTVGQNVEFGMKMNHVREAVRLGDPVALFTFRPGRIKREYDINLPRPCHLEDVTVAKSAREILDDLREEINRSLEAEYGFEVRQ